MVPLEQLYMSVTDKRSVRLHSIAAKLLQPPRPKLLQIFERKEKRLAPEQNERATLLGDRSLHPLNVVRVVYVSSVTLRVLVAILTSKVTFYPERPELNTHHAFPHHRRNKTPVLKVATNTGATSHKAQTQQAYHQGQ